MDFPLLMLLRWQQTKQSGPDVLFLSHIFHLLGDPRTSWNNPLLFWVCRWVDSQWDVSRIPPQGDVLKSS